MVTVLGEMRVTLPGGKSYRRITEEEGWESGFFRAVTLHEEIGLPVTISLYEEGHLVPKLEITTRKGFLCVHIIDPVEPGGFMIE